VVENHSSSSSQPTLKSAAKVANRRNIGGTKGGTRLPFAMALSSVAGTRSDTADASHRHKETDRNNNVSSYSQATSPCPDLPGAGPAERTVLPPPPRLDGMLGTNVWGGGRLPQQGERPRILMILPAHCLAFAHPVKKKAPGLHQRPAKDMIRFSSEIEAVRKREELQRSSCWPLPSACGTGTTPEDVLLKVISHPTGCE
jgi:hypothetical protein